MRDYRPAIDKVRENRARRWAARLDHRLLRSRAKRLHLDDHGLYQLVDATNLVRLGVKFDASLEDVEHHLAGVEAGLRAGGLDQERREKTAAQLRRNQPEELV